MGRDGMGEPLDAAGSAGAIYRRGGYVPVISGFGTDGIILPHGYAEGGSPEIIDATDLPPLAEQALGLGQPVDWGAPDQVGPPGPGRTPGVGSPLPPPVMQGTSQPATERLYTGSTL